MYVEIASRDSGEIQAFENVEIVSSNRGLLILSGYDFEASFVASDFFVFYAEV